MGAKEELNAMFNALERGTSNEPEPTQAPATESPVGQGGDVKTDAPKTDAPTTDAPEDGDKTDAPTTDAPVDDAVSVLKAENEELKRKLDEASKKAPKTEAPTTDAPIGEMNFLDGVDVTQFEDKPEELNKVLNTIYRKAVEVARGDIKQNRDVMIKTIPKAISSEAEAHKRMKALSDKFYTDNPDLKTFPKVVGIVFNELTESNKDKPLEEVLSSVSTEVRSRLGLKKPDKQTKQDKDNPPNLPRKKGTRRVQSKTGDTDPLASEISEMNKSLNL